MAIAEVKNNHYPETKNATRVKENEDPKAVKNEEKNKGYKSSKDYADYLNNKYSCLKPAKGSSVTIASGLLAKAATDGKTAQWLEYNLNLMPKIIDQLYESTAKEGGRVVSCSFSFDEYDCITTQVHAVYEADPGTEEAKKLVEEAREKNKERREQQDKLLERNKEKQQAVEQAADKREEQKENIYTIKIIGNDMDGIAKQFADKSFLKQVNRSMTTGIDVRA